MKVTHYNLSGPINPLTKQYAIWVRGEEPGLVPLVFLQRPKWIKDDTAWRKIVESVQLRLPKEFEVK